MKQVNEALHPAIQDQFNAFTEMVQKLLRERGINQDPDDPYFAKRIPVTDLNAYPELIETLQSRNHVFEQNKRLISEFAIIVTKSRLDNLQKGLEFPGNPTQLIKPRTKPLMDHEALNALIAKKPPAKRQRVQPLLQALAELYPNVLEQQQHLYRAEHLN
ncbi:hypothetical protein AYI69_g5306 [Smittium culicis]|uniref:Uncharacterized protein n=1 Tax=Smittium culicis TaxID=133412 RepID=A0A1R1Y773_9FUNG|nr:hypothetical protein AYI69_g5306 [Smittium culicis]